MCKARSISYRLAGTLLLALSLSFVKGAAATNINSSTTAWPYFKVIIVASEDAFEGDAQIGLDVNGTQVDQATVTASHTSGERQILTFDIPNPGAFRSIGVSFLNDYATGPGHDRNLYIQSVTVNGHVLTPDQGSYFSAFTHKVEATHGSLYWNGTLTWDASLLSAYWTPPLTIDVVASEDAFEGDALMGVYVNGQQVAESPVTRLHNVGEWQTLRFQVPMPQPPEGLRTVGVGYLNDYWKGDGRDRNLYIQSISINGRTLTPNLGQYVTTVGAATEATNGALYWNGVITWDASSVPLANLEFSSNNSIENSGYPLRQPLLPYYFDIAMPQVPHPAPSQAALPAGQMPEAESVGATRYQLRSEPGTNFSVWLDPKVPSYQQNTSAGVPQSLGMGITSTYQEAVKDKIMFSPVLSYYNDSMFVNLPVMHYVNFNFMLDPAYENPIGWLIHMQAWQDTGMSPPFTIEALPNPNKTAPVSFIFNIRDDALEEQKLGQKKTIYTLPVTRGVWYNMTLGLMPSYDGLPQLGTITMWLNGQQMFSYKGYWGYNPWAPPVWEPKSDVPPVWNPYNASEIGVEFGNYRGRQATTQIIYFNNIRYGTTLESVSGDGMIVSPTTGMGSPISR